MHDLGYNGIPQPSPRPPKLFVWIIIILSLIGVGVFAFGFHKYEQVLIQDLPVAKYAEQDLVISVVGDHTGQVVDTMCYRGGEACSYRVRFFAHSTDSKLVIMHEYELKDAYWKDHE